MHDVQQQFNGDPTRTFLTGFSFGGNGVFDLALAQPGTWSAIWAVDPTRVPPRRPVMPIWLSFGEIARHRKQIFIDVLDLKPAGVDPSAPGVFDDTGQDHVGSARLAYQSEQIYRWLLARSRR